MYHFLRCPALQAEQHDLISSVEAKLRFWQFPFSQKRLVPIQERTCQRWFRQLWTIFEKSISADRLTMLINDYWKANSHKPCLSARKLSCSLRAVVEKGRNQYKAVPHELQVILARHLSIRVECFTEARHRSPIYPEWCSENPSDAVFGAKIGFFQQDLSGKTSLVTVWNEEDSGDKLWNHILHSASSRRPTRFVIITSIQLAAQVLSKSNQVLELAQIPQGFLPPESDVHRIRSLCSPLRQTLSPSSSS